MHCCCFFGFIKKKEQIIYKMKDINALLFDLIQLPSMLNVNRSKCYLHHLCYFIIHLFFLSTNSPTFTSTNEWFFLAKLNTRGFFYYKNFVHFFFKKAYCILYNLIVVVITREIWILNKSN